MQVHAHVCVCVCVCKTCNINPLSFSNISLSHHQFWNTANTPSYEP